MKNLNRNGNWLPESIPQLKIEHSTAFRAQNYEIIMQVLLIVIINWIFVDMSNERWTYCNIAYTHEHWILNMNIERHQARVIQYSSYQQSVIQSSMSFLLIVMFVFVVVLFCFWLHLFFSPIRHNGNIFNGKIKQNHLHLTCIAKGSLSNCKLILCRVPCTVCRVHCADVLLCCHELCTMNCTLWYWSLFCSQITCECFRPCLRAHTVNNFHLNLIHAKHCSTEKRQYDKN